MILFPHNEKQRSGYRNRPSFFDFNKQKLLALFGNEPFLSGTGSWQSYRNTKQKAAAARQAMTQIAVYIIN
jgi:hypothetical protein